MREVTEKAMLLEELEGGGQEEGQGMMDGTERGVPSSLQAREEFSQDAECPPSSFE